MDASGEGSAPALLGKVPPINPGRTRQGRVGVNLAFLAEHMAKDAKMASGWHFQEDATPTPGEVEAMVVVLEGRHGAWAAEVAEFFSTLHSLKGDAGRSWAWAGVAELVRSRAAARLAEPSP